MRFIHRDARPDLIRAVTSPPMSTSDAAERELHGRHGECHVLDRLLASVRVGQSRVLVLRGEAGVGKTALLEYLVRRAAGCRIAQAAGAESETSLAFAGLHQLCAPFLNRIDCLPGPQRDALGTAFSLRSGEMPDRFAVGLAVLSLLSEVARERPLICVADDAQWLDPASAHALAFVARHLAAMPIAVVFGVRRSGDGQALTGLAEVAVPRLDDSDARALLQAVTMGPLDERVRDRIVAETRGNPRALLELALGLTPAELAGGFGLPGAVVLPARIEDDLRRQVASLPPATRQLLLAAAAEPTGDPVLLWRAAGHLGLEVETAVPAAAARLIEFGGLVRFRHPLGRAAVYQAAAPHERQSVHCALAEAIDPGVDPDRRAWHRALAAPGMDEDIAADLERSLGQARDRGGLAAVAAFGQRAAELTPDPARRARRALTAAQAKYQAGALEAAVRLLVMAQSGPLDDLGRARAELLRAQLGVESGRGRDVPLLLDTGRRLRSQHPRLAQEAFRDAFLAALTAGRLAVDGGMLHVAQAIGAVAHPSEPQEANDLLLDGLTVLTTQGYAAGAPMLTRAMAMFRRNDDIAEQGLGWLSFACRLSRDVWDDENWDTLSVQLTERARQAGALTVLPLALVECAAVRLLAGERSTAARMAQEAEFVTRATGRPVWSYGSLMLAAWAGSEAETRRLISDSTGRTVAHGEGRWLTAAAWATALLHNGRGRYDAALAAAEQAVEYPAELGLATWSLVELIEAATRGGLPERAAQALQQLSETTLTSGTDWALGTMARSRALLSEGEAAELLYVEAIDRLGRTRIRAELARAHLLYGEWLRRQGRRVDAREQLRAAHDMFTAMGADGFAERARRELVATGESVRRRVVGTARELTAQEAQIARLAGAGHTNPQISTQLFISPRTVEWHLRKVFTKLGISSRHELRDALPGLARALGA
jgi:DNA-binding CsgD family transcriptional regulator